MQVSIETIQGLRHRMTIVIPNSDIENTVNNKLINITKKVHVNGFRKGKAPINIIKQRYGTFVLQNVLSDLMQHNFINATIEQKINLAGVLKFKSKQFKTGEDFTYTVEFEVYPKINLKDLENIKVEKPIVLIKDYDVDIMLETLRKQQATWRETKEKVNIDSRVIIDFECTINGEIFKGGSVRDFMLIIGEDSIISPSFKNSIIGHQAGEKFNINVSLFSDNYSENLKGKNASFIVSLKKVEQRVLPELTTEFIKQFGISDGSIKTFRAEIYKNMERELKIAVRNRITTQVINSLIKENKIEVPTIIVNSEINSLRQLTAQRISGNKKQVLELPSKIFEEQAKHRVVISLLLGEIINKNSLIVDDNRVKLLIEDIASTYEDPSKMIQYYSKNKELMNKIRNLALEEQAIEILLEKVQVINKETQFQEFMNQDQIK